MRSQRSCLLGYPLEQNPRTLALYHEICDTAHRLPGELKERWPFLFLSRVSTVASITALLVFGRTVQGRGGHRLKWGNYAGIRKRSLSSPHSIHPMLPRPRVRALFYLHFKTKVGYSGSQAIVAGIKTAIRKPPRKGRTSSPLSNTPSQANVPILVPEGEEWPTGCGFPGWVGRSIWNHDTSAPSHAPEDVWPFHSPLFVSSDDNVTTLDWTLAAFSPTP